MMITISILPVPPLKTIEAVGPASILFPNRTRYRVTVTVKSGVAIQEWSQVCGSETEANIEAAGRVCSILGVDPQVQL